MTDKQTMRIRSMLHGISTVLENSPEQWKEIYMCLARDFLRKHEYFEGGQLKEYMVKRGMPPPHSHNVWGAMLTSLKGREMIIKLGEVTPTTIHTHINKVGHWRSMLYQGQRSLF